MYPRENTILEKTLNRYILEGSNGSKQQKAERKAEAGLQCESAVSWGEASVSLLYHGVRPV